MVESGDGDGGWVGKLVCIESREMDGSGPAGFFDRWSFEIEF